MLIFPLYAFFYHSFGATLQRQIFFLPFFMLEIWIQQNIQHKLNNVYSIYDCDILLCFGQVAPNWQLLSRKRKKNTHKWMNSFIFCTGCNKNNEKYGMLWAVWFYIYNLLCAFIVLYSLYALMCWAILNGSFVRLCMHTYEYSHIHIQTHTHSHTVIHNSFAKHQRRQNSTINIVDANTYDFVCKICVSFMSAEYCVSGIIRKVLIEYQVFTSDLSVNIGTHTHTHIQSVTQDNVWCIHFCYMCCGIVLRYDCTFVHLTSSPKWHLIDLMTIQFCNHWKRLSQWWPL